MLQKTLASAMLLAPLFAALDAVARTTEIAVAVVADRTLVLDAGGAGPDEVFFGPLVALPVHRHVDVVTLDLV